MSAQSASATKCAGQRRSAVGTESRHGVILEKSLKWGVIVLRLEDRLKKELAGAGLKPSGRLYTMHFGPPVPGNIYPVGLSPVLAKTKVYTVKH